MVVDHESFTLLYIFGGSYIHSYLGPFKTNLLKAEVWLSIQFSIANVFEIRIATSKVINLITSHLSFMFLTLN
jgi:hypothetical protein